MSLIKTFAIALLLGLSGDAPESEVAPQGKVFMTLPKALAKSYPTWKIPGSGIELPVIPIGLAALVTAATTVQTYYKFSEWRDKHVSASQDFDITKVKEWQQRLNTILGRYRQEDGGS